MAQYQFLDGLKEVARPLGEANKREAGGAKAARFRHSEAAGKSLVDASLARSAPQLTRAVSPPSNIHASETISDGEVAMTTKELIVAEIGTLSEDDLRRKSTCRRPLARFSLA